MKKTFRFFIVALFSLLIFACGKNKEAAEIKKEITVSAAASLTEIMDELKPLFEEKYNTKLIVNLASSGTLQRQIEEGAPVDVFISASENKMDILMEKGLLEEDARENLLKNSLVLIVNKESIDKVKSMKDLNKSDVKVSIGEPGSVPAGRYAKESLEYYGDYEGIEANLIFAKNVKQVLSYVEAGEVDAGIVYESDIVNLKNSVTAQKIEVESHSPIVYPGAVIKSSENKKSAKEFIEFFKSSEVKKLAEKYGFEI
ncbi:molybdate ABC transporter substrate-binding protein [uncultured Ilyobacter sp.]|uniref:molybdate ABC transporter substrate-binding protein n=1 Tax=uncultured Ilyobacter sp. TaxID=544433 RepID=UPI0029C6883B|nr:molybdate ABC transporter substrate-binding protein [uncultured Ilyobacter sp.]